MSLDDFLDPPKDSSKMRQVVPPSPPVAKESHENATETGASWSPKEFDVGQDMDSVFLIDVNYDGSSGKAKLTFYDVATQSLYYWFDTTGHKPYLLTTLSPSEIENIPQVVNSKDFVKAETIEKELLLYNKHQLLTKVYGSNPLNIGGDPNSFRNFISPSYEADIRYHYNYVADLGITPGTFYQIKKGKLIPLLPELDKATTEQLKNEFANERAEEIEMLNEYMPLLFQDIPDILRAAYDIEVGSDEGRLPNSANPRDPIISIALVDSAGRKIFWAYNTSYVNQEVSSSSVEIRRFDKEADLLMDFFTTVNGYPILISFNGDNFDNPYLLNRARRLKIEDIPIYVRRNHTGFESSLHLDLHVFFRQAAIRLYAFSGAYERASLEEIAQGLLGTGKLRHSDVWINKMDFATLMKYNVQDAELTLDLTNFNSNLVLNLIFTLIRITKMPFSDFTRLTVSTWLKVWLIWEHRKRNYLVPTKEEISALTGQGYSEAIIDGKKFQGAIVIEPKPGVWWDVQVLDFASLYPSIIKTRNLSYETINCSHESCKSNRVPEVGHWVCTQRVGIMSLMIGFIRDIRVKYFKPRKKVPRFRVTEQALKVLINAGYGVIGSEAFDFYCLPVAESTTAYARDAITRTQAYVKDVLNVEVLYGDTDSVFIHQPTDEQVEQLKQWSITNLGIELGKDYDFRYAIFSDRKKNYLGITADGGAIVKGLVGKKKNTPNIIRNYFSQMVEYFKQVQSESDLDQTKLQVKKLVKDLVTKIKTNQLSVDDVVIRTTLTQRLKDYTIWTQPVQAIAQLLAAKVSGAEEIDIGDTIEFVPIDNNVTVKISSTRLAFPQNEFKSVSVKPVQLINPDSDVLGRNLLQFVETAFSPILLPLGIIWEKDIMGQQSLDDFF